MSTAGAAKDLRIYRELGDIVHEYETTDREGRALHVVYQIDNPVEYREPDQGGVYLFAP